MKMSPEVRNSLEIDKSKFKTFRFDQIAFSISERVEPQNTDLEIYYGLEHLDSNSIHLTRNGVPSDVEGTKLRVYPGDIIFGKRRAYQRKAAICKVDAICSAHAMVLRANPKTIHPKLFPFFLHSDLFMNRAIDISVGSLSPTINWGTLKEQEFALPPIDQQEKLAELLWAGDDYLSNEYRLFQNLHLVLNTSLRNYFNHNLNCLPLHNKVHLSTGKRMKGGGLKEGDVISLGGENITDDSKLILDKLNYISIEFYESISKGWVKSNDIILMKDGARTGKLTILPFNLSQKMAVNEHLFIIRAKEEYFIQHYIYWFLKSDFGQNQIAEKFHGIIGGITKDDFFNLIIPQCSKMEQEEVIKELYLIQNAINSIEIITSNIKSIITELINKSFN